MKAETITFRPSSELRQGLCLLGQGFAKTSKAIGTLLNKSAHRFPYAWIFVTVLAAVIVSVVNIGQARAERDRLNKENYELREKLQSVTNEFEMSGKEVQ